MTGQTPLTESEVDQLAADWYRMLDSHVPVDEYVPLLADDVEFRFPEGTVRGFDGYRGWYEAVTNKFFDEVHTLKKVEATPRGGTADVKVVVNWQASIWKPPAARSERIDADAYQTWVVTRSARTQKAVISLYIVDSLEFAPGSATL